ncbi:hypothetical protein SK128_001839, partial [Halocaridina rubra]
MASEIDLQDDDREAARDRSLNNLTPSSTFMRRAQKRQVDLTSHKNMQDDNRQTGRGRNCGDLYAYSTYISRKQRYLKDYHIHNSRNPSTMKRLRNTYMGGQDQFIKTNPISNNHYIAGNDQGALIAVKIAQSRLFEHTLTHGN